jgi:hypothetical protein
MKRAASILALSLVISCAPPREQVPLVALPTAPPAAQQEDAPEPPKASIVTRPDEPPPLPTAQPVVVALRPDAVRDLRPGILSPRSYRLVIVEVQNLESLFASVPASSPDRPKLIRRLADTYAEIGVAVLSQGGKPQIITAARPRAIMYYTMLLTQYPRWCASPGANAAGCEDETLYHLGLEYERSGDTAQAWSTYSKLINQLPRSSFAPSTHLALGELSFEEAARNPSWLPLAEQAYRDVLKYSPATSVLQGYAQYQLGRTLVRIGDAKHAASAFRDALAWAQTNPSAPGVAALSVVAQRELEALGGRASSP